MRADTRMNKVPPPITSDKNAAFTSSPSLLTAGLPSGSMMTTPLLSPSVATKQSYRCPANQNRATTHERSARFSHDQSSQSTLGSHRTVSDTYLTLSREDINDVMAALHTLARCIQDEYHQERTPIREDDAHRLAMLYAKSTNHKSKTSGQINSSSHYRNPPRYSIRRARPSFSSSRLYLHPGDHFRNDLHRTNRRESSHWLRQFPSDEEYFPYHPHLCSYPSLSSNAIIYTSACESHCRFSGIDHPSRPECQLTRNLPSQDQSQPSVKKKLSSSMPLPSYMLDKLIYIHRNEPIPTMAMLPQQAQTLQILQTNHIRSLMSIDSLNTREKEINPNASSETENRRHLKRMDAATQWSLQSSELKPLPASKFPMTLENSTILTDISHSTATLITTHSAMPSLPLAQMQSSFHSKATSNCSQPALMTMVDEFEVMRSETERFVTAALDSPGSLPTEPTVGKKVSINDDVTCISWNDDSAIHSPIEKKMQHRPATKLTTKRSRRPRSKSLKSKPPPKRSRPRPLRHRTEDRKEDSSLDFFDVDTTLFDSYDRLFTDTTTLSDK